MLGILTIQMQRKILSRIETGLPHPLPTAASTTKTLKPYQGLKRVYCHAPNSWDSANAKKPLNPIRN